MKRNIFLKLLLLLLLMFSFCGCNGSNEPIKSIEENTDKHTTNIEVIVENRDSMEIDTKEKEDTVDKSRFYDLGKMEVADASESCFMQPMLQNPTDTGVTVQWFTENPGDNNSLFLFNTLEDYENDNAIKVYTARTQKLSRIRGGKTDDNKDNPKLQCDIYKHVAVVDDLPAYHGLMSERRYYKVVTDEICSDVYTLSARAAKGTPMRILLTSDHQTKNMVAANIQKVYETVGNVDAVFMNGDLVDVTDRAYDWFYADNSFFRCLTGTARSNINGKCYYGAPLLQQAPIYTSIGNHDVMGVYDDENDLSVQFNEPRPREQAEKKWELSDVKGDITKEEYIVNNSYNTITTEEMFENERSASGGEKYYAVTVGDIRLIVLDVSRVWRLQNVGLGGKYSEIPGISSDKYSGGDFIFESIKEGSDQIKFLDEELAKDDYKNAKIKMVMFHSDAHSLGGNELPAFTDPVAKEVVSPVTGQKMIIYDYPAKEDYIINVIEPRLVNSGTNLLFEAHSHLWNRFITASGMHVLESSNVGNSYGAFDSPDKSRKSCPTAFDENDLYKALADEWDKENYRQFGDLHGLEPVWPSVHNLPDDKPYLDSNKVTAFSILDTGKGCVDSYYFDAENPDSEVVLFDSFSLD